MTVTTIRIALASLCCFLLLASCSKKDAANPSGSDQQFELYIDFWNPSGDDPQISFDAANSSPEVKIDFSQTFEGVAEPPNLTKVLIDNVRIIDQNTINYHINRINAYEWREDIQDWKIDVEFIMQYDQVQDLAVVLVLDASASLGDDFEKIKTFANDFIRQILTEVPDARIGIVEFSDVIKTFGPTDNQTALESYISSINQGPFTTLYEAMHTGIGMLNGLNTESKALLTFTDGTDNNSDPTYTPEFIVEQLTDNATGSEVTSFTIGLEGNGGVDKPVLDQLTANKGAAAFPKNVDELGQVFERFSGSISTVYNLTYIRNQQIIPEDSPAKLRFVLESSPERL